MREYDIPFLNCWKLIVGFNEDDEGKINQLLKNALDKDLNGLKKISSQEAKDIEPNIKCKNALFMFME